MGPLAVITARRYDLIRRTALYGALGLVAAPSTCSTYYVLEPIELAGVRRLGTVQTKHPSTPAYISSCRL